MAKNFRKMTADFVSVMKLRLQIQRSLADRSPCEWFAYAQFHNLKHLNWAVYFRRVMKCHRFWGSLIFWDDVKSLLIAFSWWLLLLFQSLGIDWRTMVLWSFRKDWIVLNWKHTTQDWSVCFDKWFFSIPWLLNRSKPCLEYGRQIQW
jgi:hypothetical protein